MKNLGYFLVVAGFLGGAFTTSLDVQNVDWTLFGVTAAALYASHLLLDCFAADVRAPHGIPLSFLSLK